MHHNDKRLVEQFNHEFTSTVLPVTIFVGIEVVVGLVGNLLVIYVFVFRYHACNFRYFVLCLAFTDILSTVTTMPGEVLTQLKWYVYPVKEICKIKSFFNIFTVSSGAFSLLLIAVDRYRKVCRPFGWQIKPKVAIMLCGVIYIISAIIAVPVAFLGGTRDLQKVYKNTNITVTICEKDGEYAHTSHPFEYSSAVEGIISILLVSMFILYILVARSLVKQRGIITSATTSVPAPPSSGGGSSGVTSGASSIVGKLRSNVETSDAGISSSLESPHKYQNVSSDGGLTTDEEDVAPVISIVYHSEGSSKPQQERRTRTAHAKKKTHNTKRSAVGLRRKTWIMFILTVIFVITTVLYLSLLSMVAKSDDVLQEMGDLERAFYFFFFRLYFINHVINPVVYGVLDPHFQKVMKNMKQSISNCIRRAGHD